MPRRPSRICGCGHRIAAGVECPCERRQARARKARHDAKRPSSSARGYDGRWEKERAAFLKINRKCRRCAAEATVVDHIIPHKGDRRLFADRSNWQALCRSCHSAAKQKSERRHHERT